MTKDKEERAERRRRLNRRLLYILRYGASKLGLKVSQRGFVLLDDLMDLHLMRHDNADQVLHVMKGSMSCITGKCRFEIKELENKVMVKAADGRIMEPTVNHHDSNVKRLLNISIEQICKNIKLYDFEDFPDEFLMRRIFMQLKHENRLTNTIMKSLISSSMERYDFTDIYITESTLRLICTRCKQLKELCLGGSSYLLTDSLVRLIAKNLGQLSNLNLRSCDSVTDVSLQALMKFKTPLKILNLSFCSKVTLSGIENFIRDCSSLQVLCLNGLTYINDDVIDNLYLLHSKCNHAVDQFTLVANTSSSDNNDNEDNDQVDSD